MYRIAVPVLTAAALAAAAFHAVPHGLSAGRVLLAQDDPVIVSEHALDRAFTPARADAEIRAALAANDIDLAASVIELAESRNVPLDPDLLVQVLRANAPAARATRAAASFARGLAFGEPTDMAGFAGATVGDLFVFGDIRDVVREGGRYLRGGAADEVILALAGAGVAVTAASYLSAGAAAPARAGVSILKAARKADGISGPLASWLTRSARELAHPAALRRGLAKSDRGRDLIRLADDLGRVQRKAGLRASLDGLKLAQHPAEVAKVAKLAEKQGGKTRAILKIAGRGALALGVAAVDLALWLLWAVFTVVSACASLKRTVERATERSLARRKARRRAMQDRALANA